MKQIVFMLWAATGLYAQSAQVSGFVEDPSSSAVPKARISISNQDTSAERKTTTNEAGLYTIPLLPPGKYVMIVEAEGFETQKREGISLEVAQNARIDFHLAVGTTQQEVTVQGNASLINSEDASVGTVVDRQFVENIPLNGRSFQTLIALTPGVVLAPANIASPGQFSINGQRPDANYFTVDGASAGLGVTLGAPTQTPGGTVPAVSVTGGLNNLVSVDAMEEFRIQTSTYAPEFGRQPGGQVSIVTRSGTNQFHGAVFDYFRNDALDAADWFTKRSGLLKAAERQNDFGGVLGGPVIRDRTFFFFSYEGLRLRQPHAAVTTVPSTKSANPALNRQAAPVAIQPFLNAYPIPNGPDLGNGFAQFNAAYSDPSTLDASSIRVDHLINSKFNFFARYNYAPSKAIARMTGLSSDAESLQINTHTFTLGGTQILSMGISNEFRANYSNVKATTSFFLDNFGGAAALTDSQIFPASHAAANSIFIFILNGASGTLYLGKNSQSEQRQINFVDNVSVTHGSHQAKLGVDYRWLAPIYGGPSYSQNVFFLGMTGATGALGGVASSAGTGAVQAVTMLAQNFSLYAQDTWKPTAQLTLTYGLRWDVNPALKGKDSASDPYPIIGVNDPSTMTVGQRGTALYSTTYRNIAPRVGAAYQFRQSRTWTTVLRGGFGVFYDLGDGMLGNYPNLFPFVVSRTLTNVPFPLTQAQAAPPTFIQPPPFTSGVYAADPNLQLPRTYEWNAALEQSLGPSQTLQVTYVGAGGRDLLRNDTLFAPNPKFTSQVTVVRNTGTSDYHALQVQFQRRMARGLQALASYTWSHSIDTASNDSSNSIPSSSFIPLTVERASSDFDVRHSFSGALTYNIPAPRQKVLHAIFGDWSVDDLVIARSAPPVNVTGSTLVVGGTQFTTRPNVVQGIPLYLYGPQFPGGKAINFTANQGGAGCKGPFCPAAAGTLGNLGRNALRAFGAAQDNLSFRRQFHFTEKVGVQFRAEFFNLFNHPNFGPPTATFASALFGQSTQMLSNSLGSALGGFSPLYQIGGPRSIQLAVKITF